jgi:hypothetical protein
VFQGEQKRMRRLLVLGLTKKSNRIAKAPVDKVAQSNEARATLLSMLSA